MNLKEENEKLREILRRVYNYVPIPDQIHIDSVLSQQAEPTETYTAVDMATASAPGFRDGQSAVEQAAAQDEREAHVPDKVFQDEFQVWWEDHGQFCRAGGGDYERTFAFQAWRHLYPMLLQARATRPAQTEQQPVAWLPYLSDGADGVTGHYAIARKNPAGYREVWNLRSHHWAAFSDEVLTLDEALAILKKLEMPTAPIAQTAPQPEQSGLVEAVTPEIIDWVRCGLSVNGHLVDGTHPALEKLCAAYRAAQEVNKI